MRVSITQGCSFLPATIEEEGRKEKKKKLSSKVICHSWANFTFKSAEAGLLFWRERELVVSSGIASVICLLSSHIFE